MDGSVPWPMDSASTPSSSMAGDDDDEQLQSLSSQRLPNSNEAFAFIAANSPEEDGDLLPGVCLFTELWLAKVRSACLAWGKI